MKNNTDQKLDGMVIAYFCAPEKRQLKDYKPKK